MKKYASLAILFVILAGIFLSSCKDFKDIFVDVSRSKSAQTRFVSDSTSIIMDVESEDLEWIKKTFQGKILYQEGGIPSCGFDDSVAIIIDRENTFCIAHDTCATIYWKEKDRYFDLSKREMEKLHAILEAYGFHFPCI